MYMLFGRKRVYVVFVENKTGLPSFLTISASMPAATAAVAPMHLNIFCIKSVIIQTR